MNRICECLHFEQLGSCSLRFSGRPTAESLEGGYAIVSGEENGKPTPLERIKISIVMFTADKIVGTDKDNDRMEMPSFRSFRTRLEEVLQKT